ncbi:MAG: TolC family protein [Sphingobacteriaceae bacterium]|nr:MAG: TolC family protein [Pedobacter sp.]
MDLFLLPRFKGILVMFIMLLGFQGVSVAQQLARDTLSLTLKDAEALFLKNNMTLIAQHYNIDIAQAQVITARLFQNPQFDYANIFYNPVSKKYLDLSQKNEDNTFNGEYSAGISQLFLTAGKRNKNIRLAKIGVEQATYQFFDLLRTLRFTLRSDFFSIHFQQESEKVYNQEITSLKKILTAFKEQYGKGYISEKEVLRIQSQLYSLQTEYNSLLLNIESTQAEFKLLIKANPNVEIKTSYNYNLDEKEALAAVSYKTLLDSANTNRTDLKIAQANMKFNDMNLKVQKALAWPDITLSASFDKYGSYVTNYNSIGIAFPLPVFNRNQGGIRQAKIAIDQGKVQYQQQQQQVESDVATSYTSAVRLEQLCNNFDSKFRQDYTKLIQEVVKNYLARNIGLLDFLNFYDDYKNNTLLFNGALSDRVTALETLNFVTGTPFFNN